ncbi:hypothetical protein [Syntrophomonas wolfei]|uniref:hypothetical protein n=1 Tax=Syntrophomonas wolfei TaxID=863 RepID=UPI001588148B|nr:hypothetical protein [Syntrophomonas wolfei]
MAHIINAEGEKLQAVLGTLPGLSVKATSISGLLSVNREVRRVLQTLIKNQMLLQFKLEDIMDIPPILPTPPTPPTPPPIFINRGSAWGVGEKYGTGNAQYFTLESTDIEKSVVLGLGRTKIPVGTVNLLRQGTNLLVTFTTDFPYVMHQVHLYVGNSVPKTHSPGLFPYKYPSVPDGYFTTYTFNVDVSSIPGTIYVAAHAKILEQV